MAKTQNEIKRDLSNPDIATEILMDRVGDHKGMIEHLKFMNKLLVLLVAVSVFIMAGTSWFFKLQDIDVNQRHQEAITEQHDKFIDFLSGYDFESWEIEQSAETENGDASTSIELPK